MPRFDDTSAECLVYTFKEGVLSAIAHDLKIRVSRFSIEIDEARAIEARFEARSLRVDAVMRSGIEDKSGLGDGDKRKIEKTIVEDVLDAAKYHEIRFVSRAVEPAGDGFRIEGDLTLHGVKRALSFTTQAKGEQQVAEVRLHQPDFKMKPYSAMLGTLKIKPDVIVKVSIKTSDLPKT